MQRMGRSMFQEEGTAGAKALRQQGRGGLEECEKVPIGGAQHTSQLSSYSRCSYLLDDHPPGVHLTRSTPGEAALHEKQAPTLILSQNGCDYVLHARPEFHPPIHEEGESISQSFESG